MPFLFRLLFLCWVIFQPWSDLCTQMTKTLRRHSTSLPNSPPSPRASAAIAIKPTSCSTPKGRQKGNGRIVTSSSGGGNPFYFLLSWRKEKSKFKKELAGMLLEREDGRERRSLQPYRGCLSQDDSLLGCSSGILPPFTQTLRRFGSCESGDISINSRMIEEWHLFFSFKDFVAVFLAYQIVLLLKRCLRWAKDIPPSAFLTSAKLKPIPNSADSFIQCAFLLEGDHHHWLTSVVNNLMICCI